MDIVAKLNSIATRLDRTAMDSNTKRKLIALGKTLYECDSEAASLFRQAEYQSSPAYSPPISKAEHDRMVARGNALERKADKALAEAKHIISTIDPNDPDLCQDCKGERHLEECSCTGYKCDCPAHVL